MMLKRNYTISVVRTGKVRKVKSALFAFDATKKIYPDILKGEYYGPAAMRFYSQKHGYILTSWE